MTADAIWVTILSSLISGIVGVLVSTWYFYKLERHKLKLDLARRLLGNRFSITGDAFSCAVNEVIAVFADIGRCAHEAARAVRGSSGPREAQCGNCVNRLSQGRLQGIRADAGNAQRRVPHQDL